MDITMNVREKLVELIFDSINLNTHTHRACNLSTAIADDLIAHGVTVQEWIPASKPPQVYRDEYGGELIPFLVCEEGTEYPFRAMYDGKTWGDGFFAIPVTHWMPLPQPPKGE